MSGREDGLPHPVSGTQEYLAAILAELRGLSATLSPPAPAEAPAAEAEPAPALVQVREPVVSVALDDEPIPVAETPTPPAEPPLEDVRPAKAKTTRKRTTRKKPR